MNQERPIKWGCCVPLIGGMALGNQRATGENPSFIISYEAFAANDSHCVNRFPDTPYILADTETNLLPEQEKGQDLFSGVDFVSAVCPCAGLSLLNSSSKKGSSMYRGADAKQNDWMYNSTRLILEQVRPRVLWGENAPGLYTTMGEQVAERLRLIGKEFGYSFSLVKTDTFLHGIPQHRMRTFYFFWRDSEAPILGYHKKAAPLLSEYLSQIPEGASLMDKPFGIGDVNGNDWFKFAKHKGHDVKSLIETGYKTIFQWIYEEKMIDEALTWAQENEEKGMIKFLEHVKRKIADNKGWWDGSPLMFKEATNAIIAKNSAIIHPDKDRGITVREAMWLMGLPHDFEMAGKQFNHICQNVPVNTATDWTGEIIRFLKGEIKEFGGSFVKQNNISQRIDHEEKKNSKVLF